MTKEELIKEFNNTNSVCGIPVSSEFKRALQYASIRLEQLEDPKPQPNSKWEKLKNDIKTHKVVAETISKNDEVIQVIQSILDKMQELEKGESGD